MWSIDGNELFVLFEDVDEDTAMYKLAATANEITAQGSWVPLNIDASFPSDSYLRLAEEASKMLLGRSPLQSGLPITP